MPQNLSINSDENLTGLFISETHEQLERFVEILLNWDQYQEDPKKTINELFRIAHNIKGSAGMMGLNELKETVHLVENLFDEVRKEKLELNVDLNDSLLKFSDDVLSYIENCQWEEIDCFTHWKRVFDAGLADMPLKPTPKKDTPLILSAEEKTQIAAWQEQGKSAYGIDVQFYPEAEMQGASALIFIKALLKYGQVFKTAPLEADLKEEKFTALKIVFMADQPLTPEEEAAIISYPTYDVTNVDIRKWVYRPEEATPTTKQEKEKPEIHIVERTIRVEASKIDRLINQVGELINIKIGLIEILNYKSQILNNWNQLTGIAQRLEQMVSSLHMEVMDLRMVPVRTLFSRFSRIVHDISKQKGKQIEFSSFGEDTEIDKQIAEQLVDPLTHLIRNAVDHGLEKEEIRLEIGKPRVGKLNLGAYHEGEYIVISVSDDGQGLNLEKIREKGIKNGLIHEDDQLTEDQIQKLIFQPGFSTAERVSDISGRGVGLDVVQESIKNLKGDIIVDSIPNQGTTFRLKVPLTLAVIQSFMIKINGQIFGIPAADVIESLAISPHEIHQIVDKQVFSLRQEAITLVNLAKIFHFKPLMSSEKIPIIIVQHAHTKYGLIVEELIGQEEIIIKQINKALSDNPLISGAAIVGNGDIALILDTHQIIKKSVY